MITQAQQYPKWLCPKCGKPPARGTWNGITICCHEPPVLCQTARQEATMRCAYCGKFVGDDDICYECAWQEQADEAAREQDDSYYNREA
jgi:hypothetical protein